MTRHFFSYLALGDSYTIAESLPLYESFPYQLLQLLRKHNLHFHAPEIIAQTGWTTFELAEHLLHTRLNDHYDFVTLLIGVNNQYRGLNSEDYKTDFEFLLKKALHLAGEKNNHVIVLSIPDWSVTPFAKNKDAAKITDEINAYNAINKKISGQHKVHYIDITPNTRLAENDELLIAKDGLHPSAKAYQQWAIMIADVIQKILKT
ncbi:SGNH/GDSL hydrolase family protein [soil metagenome]